MSLAIRIGVVSAALLLALPSHAAAAPNGSQPSALLLQAALEKSPADAAVVVMAKEARYVYDAEGKRTVTHRMVYRIVKETAIGEWSAVYAPYAPWYQERPEIKARVITSDGVVHELDPATIDDAPVAEGGADIYSDSRLLRAPLPALAAGAIVEHEVVTRDKALFFAAGVTDNMYFSDGAYVAHARLSIEAPVSLKLNVVNRLGSAGTETRSERDGVQTLVFEARDLPMPENLEAFVPGDVHQLPYVAFSNGRSWNEIARSYAAIVDRQIADASVATFAKSAIAGAKSRNEIIEKLVAKLHQNVRYTGIEFGEASIVPRSPSEVFKRKYGDCKDKSALLVAMLRTVGIDANVVTLRAGFGNDVDRELPGFGVFNHAIVVVRGTPEIWIDPTDEFARVGELPQMDQGRLAMVADPATQDLIFTPRLSAKQNRSVETRVVTLREDGPARITETTTSFGSFESEQRHFFGGTDAKALKEAIENYAKGAYNSDSEAKFSFGKPSDLSRGFVSTIEVEKAKRGITNGGLAAVGIFPSGLMNRLPYAMRAPVESGAGEKAPRRKYDFMLNQPFTEEWSYRIEAPAGFRARELPASEERAIGPFKLLRRFEKQSDGSVTAELSFRVDRERLTPDEVEKTRADYAALVKEPAILVNFEQTATALMEEGKVRDSLAEFRRLGVAHPREALHRYQLAIALLETGLGEQAREEARAAVKLEPSSAAAHRALGWILQHDLLGRRFYKGFDLKGSIAAYRQARELNPKDVPTRSDLAILLEHNAAGVRYGVGSSLKDAVVEYEAMRADTKDESMNENLLFALLWSRDFVRLREVARSMNSAPTRDGMLLAAVAEIEGVPAAVRFADSLNSDKDQRRANLASAATHLLQLRDYKLAADIFDGIVAGAPNAAEISARSAVIRSAVKHEELKIDANDPRSAVIRMMIAVMSKAEVSAEDVLPLFASTLREVIQRDVDGFLRGVRGRTPGREAGMPREAVTDMALASLRYIVDGDEKGGFRVRPQPISGARTNESTFIVAKDAGSYRIFGMSQVPSAISGEIERKIADGELAAAKQWLDWTREELAGSNDDQPFAEHPLVRFWKKGSNEATTESLRLANAALMASGTKEQAEPAEAFLVTARQKASPEMQLSVDVALMSAYARKDDAAKLLAVAQRLLVARPDSDAALGAATASLARLRRFDEASALIETRLAADPRNAASARALSDLAGQKSDYDASAKLLQTLVERGEATAGDYNSLAWLSLFRTPFAQDSVTDARKAAEMSQASNWPILHTLAAVYAEAGKPLEARQVILRSMEVAGSIDPRSEDWYVFGRIAEEYGEKAAAIAAYKRVERPEREEAMSLSTYVLAERRLKAISGKP